MERVLVAACSISLSVGLIASYNHLSAADGSMASPLASLCVSFGPGQIRNTIGEKATRPHLFTIYKL